MSAFILSCHFQVTPLLAMPLVLVFFSTQDTEVHYYVYLLCTTRIKKHHLPFRVSPKQISTKFSNEPSHLKAVRRIPSWRALVQRAQPNFAHDTPAQSISCPTWSADSLHSEQKRALNVTHNHVSKTQRQGTVSVVSVHWLCNLPFVSAMNSHDFKGKSNLINIIHCVSPLSLSLSLSLSLCPTVLLCSYLIALRQTKPRTPTPPSKSSRPPQ
jgi:hypothetical protein